ncbi:hypothetical protein F1B92_00230 [Campylobacter sp. FMV-PI01]|uniref:HP0268 domain-containing protein n=1 Tax=Campylobacter portucalensis TaxID=2608384 RepID=A0A6L5WF70_9BACT|nr:HP0268 family nuclease [Campylobacter portucalensis]MSN95638.1 hypothetical protein [Campylobacter portucalensis]
MELKLARKEPDKSGGTITLEKIEQEIKKAGQKIFYFDRENQHKDLIALIEHFESNGMSAYLRTVKYGLDDNEYMYEVHIL